MTIKTICEDALNEIGGFEVPTSFSGNGNLTATQCIALLNREGKTLEKEERWSALISTHTFTTVADTASYALPTDFRAFAEMSQWDRTNTRQMIGPTPGFLWQYLKGGIISESTIDRWFRIQGSDFYIHPTPSATGDTIAFDYYSKDWVNIQATGLTGTRIASDNDTGRLDEDLLTLGLKWRFLQAKGMPFEPEYKEYEALKTELVSDDGGSGLIRLGQPRYEMTNLPDQGYGS